MFGFNRITKKHLSDNNIMTLVMIQQIAFLISEGKEFKDATIQARKNVLKMRDSKDNAKSIKQNKLSRKSCEFALYGGDDFDICLLETIKRLSKSEIKKLMSKEMIVNSKNSKRYFKKYFGLETNVEKVVEVLNSFIEDEEFSTELILRKSYPIIYDKDELSIKEISEKLMGHNDFKFKDLEQKINDINKVLEKFNYVESCQKLRFLKQSMIYILETESVDLLEKESNTLRKDIENVHKDFTEGEKSKNIIVQDIQEISDDLDIEFDFDFTEPKEENKLNVRKYKDKNKNKSKYIPKPKPDFAKKSVYKR